MAGLGLVEAMTRWPAQPAPGEALYQWIDAHDMTQSTFAYAAGISEKYLSQIIRGKIRLSPTMAYRLEEVTKIPLETWLQREALSRAFRFRCELALRSDD